jgi:uncharacterized lipoprotein YajG
LEEAKAVNEAVVKLRATGLLISALVLAGCCTTNTTTWTNTASTNAPGACR